MLNYPVIDGVALRRDFRCNLTWLSMAWEQMDALCRAGNMRPKQWTFPGDMVISPVPAFDVAEKTLRVGIGAVLWGYQISAPYTGEEADGTISGFQVTDACNDQALFSEPNVQQATAWPGDDVNGVSGPIVLPRPLVIGKPGILKIQLMTRSNAPARQQIVLYGGQPVGVNV